jgi:uncharacterized protein
LDLFIAFLTGLTTGGLSCLAVQGGLLASSIAHQVELSVTQPQTRSPWQGRGYAARPILLFLGSKLIAYTLLGFLLGWLGSLLQLSLFTRALFQLAIGIFMIGTALRMFDVHPIFRYFAFEPPSAVTRYIRRRSKVGDDFVTPLFLGALTVLIPCGVTQAMMVVAMGTGNPFSGAAILFAFVLGTSPVFFLIAFLATQLGARLESRFKQFVGVMVLVLGLVSIDSGLNLMGSPYSFTNLTQAWFSPASSQSTVLSTAPTPASTHTIAPVAVATTRTTTTLPQASRTPAPRDTSTSSSAIAAPTSIAPAADAVAILTIDIKDNGYSPSLIQAEGGKPFQIKLVTDKTSGCARAFVIPKLGIQKIMPATGTALLDIPAQPSGSELRFACSMGMYTGKIQFK